MNAVATFTASSMLPGWSPPKLASSGLPPHLPPRCATSCTTKQKHHTRIQHTHTHTHTYTHRFDPFFRGDSLILSDPFWHKAGANDIGVALREEQHRGGLELLLDLHHRLYDCLLVVTDVEHFHHECGWVGNDLIRSSYRHLKIKSIHKII